MADTDWNLHSKQLITPVDDSRMLLETSDETAKAVEVGGFREWLMNTALFNTLTTTAKNIIGAIEEVKGIADNNTTSLNEKVNKTNEDKNYYVNVANGNDANDGLSINTPFKTIQKALNLIPQVVNNNITINVDGINYAERFNAKGFIGYGKINIIGSGVDSCKINFISSTATKCELEISNINVSNDNSVNTLIINSDYVKIKNCKYPTVCPNTGIQANNSNLEINSCSISNKNNAVVSDKGSIIISINNTGENNANCLYADNGATISKSGTQPNGTVAEISVNGGVIR